MGDRKPEVQEPPKCYPQFLQLTKNSNKLHLSPATGKTPRGEKEAVAELLMILVECMEELNTRSRETLLRKFFSEIEKDERLESFIIERLRQSKVKAISELLEKLPKNVLEQQINSNEGSSTTVGVGASIISEEAWSTSTRSLYESVEELSEQLERFKIRTLDLGGGVVKEEEEENK